jgi:septum formation protein
MKRRLLLASSSPQRAMLLKELGVAFRIAPSGASERASGFRPAELARFLALRKADRIRSSRRGLIIVSADTIVVVGGTVLEKPRSPSEAIRQLHCLSGRKHFVITGLAIRDPSLGLLATSSELSAVTFRRLGRKEILDYVGTGDPLGKAGSYGIQGRGSSLVASLAGDYYNVVGFPIALFASMGLSFGLKIQRRRIMRLYESAPKWRKGGS